MGPPASAGHAEPTSDPLFRVETKADVASVAAGLLLTAGALLLALGPAPEAAVIPQYVLVTVAVLALLQAVSGSSALGKMVLDGGAAAVGVSLGTLVWALQPGSATGPPPSGVVLALLGSLVALVAMDLERREAGRAYVEMARRAVQLSYEPTTLIQLVRVLLPFALVGAAVLFIGEFGPEVAGKFGAIFIQYFFNPIGKEVAIFCGIHSCPPLISGPPLHPLQVAAFLVFIDATTALFLAWNYRYVLRVPFLGHILRWIEEHGRKTVEKRAWIRRLAFFGVMFYAAGPFEGTGAIGGTIVGRTIGLDATRTWGAVVSGSIIRTTILTLSVVVGTHLFDRVREQPLGVQVAFAATGVLLLVLAWTFIRRRRRQRKAAGAAAEAK